MKPIRADKIKVNDIVVVKTESDYSVGRILKAKHRKKDKSYFKVKLWAKWRDFNIKTKKERFYPDKPKIQFWGSNNKNTVGNDNHPVYLLKENSKLKDMKQIIIALII